MVRQIEEDEIKFNLENEPLKDSKTKLTKYSLVRDAIEVYLKERKKDYERGFIQISTYEQDVKDFNDNNLLVNYGILDKTINEVDEEYAKDYVDYLWDTKLAENTIYKPFSFIRKVFNYFKKDLKIIKDNPFDNIKNKPHAVSDEKEYLTDEEMHYIKERIEFENIRFRTLITLIMDTGVRREEALAFKFSDINKFRGTMTINRAFIKSPIDNRYIIKPVKRKKSEREIIVPAYTLELIEKYRQFKIACGFVVNDDDYIFTAWDSMELIDPDRHSKEFKNFIKKIGLKKDVPLKNLRDTHTTFFVSKGKNLKAVQKRVGHANVETTLGIYSQTNLNEDRKLVDAYEEEFYNKLGLSMSDLYRIVSNRFDDNKKLTSVLERVCNEYIDGTNFDINLERCQDYFRELFPIFDKILNIDSSLDDEEIDALFEGFTPLYRKIKIESLDPKITI